MSTQLLQIFAKAPVLGQVKTRLAVDIGEVKACEVYRSLLFNTVKSTVTKRWQTELWCSPDSKHSVFELLAKQYGLSLEIQCKGDLGERMLFALKAGNKQGRNVVLIGSDCPAISAEYIEQAFVILETHDVVFGPAEDGGYVLVGCSNNAHDNMFNEVEFSCENTLVDNIKAVERCGLSYGLLDTLWDLDELCDLNRAKNVVL